MKIKLLNDSTYRGMNNVKFPAIVEVKPCRIGAFLLGQQLISIGASESEFEADFNYFFLPDSIEVINED